MIMRKGFVSVVVLGVILILGSLTTSETLAPLWHFKIENMTDSAMSRNGEYVFVTCEKGPLCEKGQYYVLDWYGNTVVHGCIEGEITVADIADNGAFFMGTRNGYYFSLGSGRIYEDLDIGSIVETVSISKNGEIVVAGTNKEILILDSRGMRTRKEVGWPVNSTAVDASGDTVVAGTVDTIFLYRKSTNTWTELQISSKLVALAISDDGSIIVCGMVDGTILILDSMLKIQKGFPVSGLTSIAVTTDGKYFVCGTRQGDIIYFDSSGEEIWTYDVKNDVQDVAISFDGNLIAALHGDIMLLNSSREELQEIESTEIIQSMHLSDSGEILCYSSGEELIFVKLYQYEHSLTYEHSIPSRKDIPLDDQLIEVWSYGETGETPYSVRVADINGDKYNEIICNFDRKIVVLNSTGGLLWEKTFSFRPGFTIMDLTGDFIPEVVVNSTDNRMQLLVLDGRGIELARHEFYSRWYATPPSEEWSIGIHPLWSCNIDNDDFIEVICHVSASYILEPRGFYVFEYSSFEDEWYYPVAPFPSTIHLVDINGDGQNEILGGSYAPCNARHVGDTNDCQAYLYAITLQGEEIWTKQIGTRGYKRIDIAVADLDGDGNQEIVGGGWSYEDNWGTLFVLDSEGDYILGEENKFNHSVFLEAVADLNSDGKLEILASYSPSTLVLYDHQLKEIKRQNVSIRLSNSGKALINDIDADGEKEIILSSEDKMLLILNADLEEEWNKTFVTYYDYLKAAVVNLQGCKNHLLVLSDKLYAYTYSHNSEWPCIPWIIIEQQKIVEAEDHIVNGTLYFNKKEYESAVTEYIKAKNIYEQIENKEKAALTEEKILIAQAYLTAEKSYQEALRLLEEENREMAEKHLLDAYNAYIIIGNQGKVREIEQYLEMNEEIKDAEYYFDLGKNQIIEGKIEEGLASMDKAKAIYEKYGWTSHMEEIELTILGVRSKFQPTDWWGMIQVVGAIIFSLGVILSVAYLVEKQREKKTQRIIKSLKESKREPYQVIETDNSPLFKEGGK